MAHTGMSFKHTFVRWYNEFRSYLKNSAKQLEADIENGVAYKKKECTASDHIQRSLLIKSW